MNRKSLEEIYYITREEKMWERRLQEIREKSKIGGQPMNGMPHTQGDGNRVENEAIEAINTEEIIKGMMAKIQIRRSEVTQFINSVEDSQMRQILECRCIELMPWWKVAETVGGNNTEESVKKKYYRFMNKHFPKKKKKKCCPQMSR